MREDASAYSGTEYVDAAGLIRVSGSAWQVNVVDAQVKLRKAAIREVTKLRKLLAELDSASEKPREEDL